jgi:hypothetical protein
MRKAIVLVALGLGLAASAHAKSSLLPDVDDATVVGRAGSYVVLTGTAAGHHDVWIARTDVDAPIVGLLEAAKLTAKIEVALSSFAKGSGLTAVLVTTSVKDTRGTSRAATEYLVRAGDSGAVEIVCAFPAKQSFEPTSPACGAGQHRVVTLTPEGTDGDAQAGSFKFAVTSQVVGDFWEKDANGNCTKSSTSTVEYEPVVTHYEIDRGETCTLRP